MADEDDDAREWEIAEVVESNEEAVLVAGFLESNGIPAQVESLHVEELPVNLGALGEVRVRVPAGRLEEARALLAAGDRGETSLRDDEPAPEAPEPAGAGAAAGAPDRGESSGE